MRAQVSTAEKAQELIAKKAKRSYTDKPRDLQEADGAYLAAVREVYLKLAKGEPSWRVVPCLKDGELRSIEQITDELFEIVQAAQNA